MLINRLYDTDLNTVVTMLGKVSAYTIYYQVLDRLKLLLHRAVFTFRELAQELPESEQLSGQALIQITEYLISEIYLHLRSKFCLV